MADADLAGHQLGNYRLNRLLGKGGFADVYLGEHVYLGTFAAIKVLQMRLGNDELQSFLDEARTVARLVHPHIVRVLEFGVEADTPFLVMDYAPHGTLSQRHPKGRQVPLDLIVSYVRQVAAALQYAHNRKFIHRDVKPQNMLVGSNNEVLLSDFGIALVTQSSHHQKTEDAVGTLVYMAPEQLEGKPRPASDQYALGIVVYEWLSGDRPFHGSFTEVASQHMLATPPPLREKVPGISPEIEQVLQTALAKNPSQRFANVQIFATALEQASRPLLLTQNVRQNLTPLAIQASVVNVPLEQPSQPMAITLPSDKPPVLVVEQPKPLTPLPAPLSQSPQPVMFTPTQPTVATSMPPPALQNAPQHPKRDSSRRAFVFGLAGLAGLSILGGGITLLMLQPQTSPASSTSAQSPTSNPTQTPTAQPTSTPTPRHKPPPTDAPSPTPTHTSSLTPTPTDTSTPSPTPTPTPVPIVSSGQGVLPAGRYFSFDQGSELSSGGDVYWHIRSSTLRTMDPKGSARLANIGVVDFDSITAAQLENLSYGTTPINGNHLATGDVFAVLTNGSNHAKVEILAYGYNLKIKWVTYKG